MQVNWQTFSADTDFDDINASMLKDHWDRLHLGDRQEFPKQSDLQAAWLHYHRGEFELAYSKAYSIGGSGLYIAGKAMMIHAIYLSKDDDEKLEQYQHVAELADDLIDSDADDANGYYLKAFALGRYSQGISVTKALSQGLGGKIKDALSTALALQPKHADAHIAMGLYNAEIIDKIGGIIGKMTYGASEKQALSHFKEAQTHNSESAIAKIEYANGLILLKGDKAYDQASDLYVTASEMVAADAMEALDIDMAKSELE